MKIILTKKSRPATEQLDLVAAGTVCAALWRVVGPRTGSLSRPRVPPWPVDAAGWAGVSTATQVAAWQRNTCACSGVEVDSDGASDTRHSPAVQRSSRWRGSAVHGHGGQSPGSPEFRAKKFFRITFPLQRKLGHLGPDLQNILRQSYDYLTIMPKLRSTYDGRLIYKTSHEGRKAFLRYDSLAEL